MKKTIQLYAAVQIILWAGTSAWPQAALVLQSDFGVKDGAVATMKGVAYGISSELRIFDLTHEIPPFNVWEAALRLEQTAPYWPAGTVFVSVVDPGVGTERKSIVLLTKTGHYFVTPDNGTLTFVAETLGIAAVREIDEAVNRRRDSQQSYTFHGRDVYAFTGARLAAGIITFEQVGRELPPEVFRIPYQKPHFENGVISGTIPILDIQFGNVWTNLDREVFRRLEVSRGDSIWVSISRETQEVYQDRLPFVNTFGEVPVGDALIYLNSLNQLSLAINQGNFAQVHHIGSGPEWRIRLWQKN